MSFGASRHVVSFIRFSHHDGCRLVHPDMWYYLFGSPITTDAVWCIPACGIIYSVSNHDGCRLVHPDMWYHLFGSPIMTDAVWYTPTCGITYSVLPSRRMPFGASRHVVFLIRFSHHDGCRLVHPDMWYHLFGSPIMTDAVWYTPTCGITYSVLPSRRMPFGASRHVVSFIRSPIMTDVVWCIPTCGIIYSVLPS